jgi:hypothetical protein
MIKTRVIVLNPISGRSLDRPILDKLMGLSGLRIASPYRRTII